MKEFFNGLGGGVGLIVGIVVGTVLMFCVACCCCGIPVHETVLHIFV